jgi:hypothetical protein
MAIAVKVLAQGQLANAKATLYTVPGGTLAYVKFFSVCNVASTNQDVEILVNTAGTSRRIAYVSLGVNQGARIVDKDEAITLEAGDLVEGFSTDATSVDYVITGAEEA